MINTNERLGQYVGISKRAYRGDYVFAIYGAINAFGLIGSEYNGIVVLNEKEKCVVCDGIEGASTGYFGPSDKQLKTFERMVAMNDVEFAAFINAHPRRRMEI